MRITYKSENYEFNKVNSEHFGLIEHDGAYSAVYEQRDRKGTMIKTWQCWLKKPEDVLDYLSDFCEKLQEATKAIGTSYWMVRV